jgi:VCBS repeat-containing protein
LAGIFAGDGEGTASIELSLFVNGQEEVLPANIGVQADGSMADTFTLAADGVVGFTPDSNITLETFFDTWRTNAGQAGNNASANFNQQQLLGNATNINHLVKMFVDGQVVLDYEDYVLQDGDQITVAYTDNPVVSVNTNFGSILVELFEDETPGTVDNFLNYVNDGDYVDSFIHRSVPGFVIQGGGFKTTDTTFTSTAQFSSVPTDPAIPNEPFFSNVRGTIAMAKTSQPISATSQFFFNLSDDNSFLDATQFTVFGRVLGMTVVDAIASFPVDRTNFSPYGELPLTASNELTVVSSVTGHGELVGEKYLDINANGIRDPGEVGIPNAIIYIDANGNRVRDDGELFATTDANGDFRLATPPGEHTVRAGTTPGTTQTQPISGYSSVVAVGRDTIGMVFGESPLLAPTAIDLLADSDTGIANDDNLTRLNNAANATLQFEVSGAAPGAEVLVLADGLVIGSAVASGQSTSVTVTTNGTSIINDGVVQFSAIQLSNAAQSVASPSLGVTVETVAPGLVDNIPTQAQAGVVYTFDATSSDEGIAGTLFGLVNPPNGMTIDPVTGIVSWTPTIQQAVPQTIELTVADAAGNTTSLQSNVNVLGVIPGFPESYAALEDSLLTIAVDLGVLDNDGDQNSGVLTAAVITAPTHGTLLLGADGSFTYMPATDFFGSDSFTYQAKDDTDVSNVVLVSIDINGIDDEPRPFADGYTLNEDQNLDISTDSGVLSNDVEVDGEPLTADLVQTTTNGTLVFNIDGSFSYSPNSNFFGDDSFSYTVTDGTTISAATLVTLTVLPIPDAPTANGDDFTLDEDSTFTISAVDNIVVNDSDPDSAVLTAVLQSGPSFGTLGLNSDGTFTYTPNPDFFGSDSFTYRASDGMLESDIATVSLSVTGVADSPTAVNDTTTATNQGAQLSINVLANDSTEPDGQQTLTITHVSAGSQGGSITNQGDSILYTAPIGFTGQETFTYTVTDADGLTDLATVVVDVVEAANSAIGGRVYIDLNRNGLLDTGEVGLPGSQIILQGTGLGGISVSRTVLTDSDGMFLIEELPAGTYQLQQTQPAATIDGLDSSTVSGAVVSDDLISNIVLADDQTLTGNHFGELAVAPQYVTIHWLFASQLSLSRSMVEAVATGEEMAGNTELANAIRNSTATLPPQNAAPTAGDDSYQTGKDVTLVVVGNDGLLNNDSDADTDPLSISIIAEPTNGAVVVAEDGGFTYTPNTGFVGQETFTYQVSDGQAVSNVATVQINVQQALGSAPVAVDDAYTIVTGQVLEVPASNGVLANDTDVDADVLSSEVLTQPSHGTLTLFATGQFVYTSTAAFTGVDTFSYRVTDGQLTDTGEVTVTVQALNVAPVAAGDAYTVAEDTTLSVPVVLGVLANDTDVNSDSLTAEIVSSTSHGLLTLDADGSLTYVPENNFVGDDTFTYVADDGQLTSANTTATITVTAVNDPPETTADEYHVLPNQTLTISAADGVSRNDIDIDDDTLTVSIVSGAANGGVLLSESGDGSFTYVPIADFSGDDSFIYQVTDGGQLTAQETVTVHVTNDNLASFRLETTLPDGTPISSIDAGDKFLLAVYTNDERASGLGVQAAYIDLLYDSTLVTLDSAVAFYPPNHFTDANFDDSVAGRVDELGAARSDLRPLSSSERLLATMIFRADAVGTALLSSEAADDLPSHELLLLRDPIGVALDQVFYGSASIEIVAGGSGEPVEDFESAVDQLMTQL